MSETEQAEVVLINLRDTLKAVSEFCDHTQPFVGERFKKQLRNTIRAVPRTRASVAAPQGVAELLDAALRAPAHAESYIRQAIEMLASAPVTAPVSTGIARTIAAEIRTNGGFRSPLYEAIESLMDERGESEEDDALENLSDLLERVLAPSLGVTPPSTLAGISHLSRALAISSAAALIAGITSKMPGKLLPPSSPGWFDKGETVSAGRIVDTGLHGEPTRTRLREIESSIANGYEIEYRKMGWSKALQFALRDLHFLLTFFNADTATPAAPSPGEPRDPCANCGHIDPHDGPAGTVDDACTVEGCNCGYYQAAALRTSVEGDKQ